MASAIATETKAFIDAMSVRPSAAEVLVIDSFIKTLKNCGAWSAFDAVFFLLTGSDSDSRINAKAPGTYNLTKVNSPRFNVGLGWDSNNAGYLDSGFNPSTAGGHYQQTSACLGVAVVEDMPSAGVIGQNASSLLAPHSVSDSYQGRINNTVSRSVSSPVPVVGLHVINRTGTNVRMYRRGALADSGTSTAVALVNDTITILTRSNGASLSASGLHAAFAFIGGSLTGLQIAEINKAYAAYAAFYGVSS